MSQFLVSNWNNILRHHRQEQVEVDQDQDQDQDPEGANRFPHVDNQLHNLNIPQASPMSNFEIAELTWENGQLAMNGLGGLHNSGPTKPTWATINDTLESIVHQATYHKHDHNLYQDDPQPTPPNKTSVTASFNGDWPETSTGIRARWEPSPSKKPAWSDFTRCTKSINGRSQDEFVDQSGCASASANATFDSLPSLRTKTTDEDSAFHCISDNQYEDREAKTELTTGSHSRRKRRAAAVHNLSERRRRDRINEKMKTLQKLVPNASKTDKASMLDEVIDYLKQLQAQVQIMSIRNITTPHMMLPLGVQQHLQKSLLMARMGMGMPNITSLGRGMPESLPPFVHLTPTSPLASTTSTPTFLPPHFVFPALIPQLGPARCNQDPGANHSLPLADPYCTFLAQSMNVDFYNKMAALHQQRIDQATQATSHPSQSNVIPK